jgi:hypothetical protein
MTTGVETIMDGGATTAFKPVFGRPVITLPARLQAA